MKKEEREKYYNLSFLQNDAIDIVRGFNTNDKYLRNLIHKYSDGKINPDSFNYSTLLHHGYFIRGRAEKKIKEKEEFKKIATQPKEKKKIETKKDKETGQLDLFG